MSVKQTFVELRDLLKALPEIETVRFYNNQFEKENVENAFNYPAVFIEFLPIEWKSERYKLQTGESEINLHIAVVDYNTENVDELDAQLQILDTVELVNKALQNYSSDVIKNPLTRLSSEQDIDHSNLIVYKDTYRTKINDYSNSTETDKTVLASGTLSIDLTPDLDVQEPVFRTGDGTFTLQPDPPPTLYDPLTDNDLVMFYDYSGLVNNTDNSYGTVDAGGLISNWKNLKGVASYDLVQATTSSKPVLNTDYISSDGINDFLESIDLPTEIKSGNDFTFIMVGENIGGLTSNAVCFQGVANHFLSGLVISSNLGRIAVRDNPSTTDGVNNNLVLSTGEVFKSRINYKLNYSIIVNETTGQTGTEPKPYSPVVTKLNIGRLGGSTVVYLPSRIKAVMVWKNEIIDAQKITDINTYLAGKW